MACTCFANTLYNTYTCDTIHIIHETQYTSYILFNVMLLVFNNLQQVLTTFIKYSKLAYNVSILKTSSVF